MKKNVLRSKRRGNSKPRKHSLQLTKLFNSMARFITKLTNNLIISPLRSLISRMMTVLIVLPRVVELLVLTIRQMRHPVIGATTIIVSTTSKVSNDRNRKGNITLKKTFIIT